MMTDLDNEFTLRYYYKWALILVNYINLDGKNYLNFTVSQFTSCKMFKQFKFANINTCHMCII